VLKRLAEILSCAVMPFGRVYRFAGDEFVCIVPRNDVVSVCDTIRSNVRKEDSFTISQGVLMRLNRGITNEAFTQADTALYQSKKQGKDRITMVIPTLAQAN
jgi:diguanylate cyclase (GGDEF)-like protein